MAYKITYSAINRRVEFNSTSNTLLGISIKNRIPHLHECGGNGICTACRVRSIIKFMVSQNHKYIHHQGIRT